MNSAQPNQRAKARPRIHYGLVVAVVCSLINLTTLGFGRFAYTLILPSMKDALGLTYAQTGLLATGNFVGYMLGSLVVGVLTARYGVRLVSAFLLAFTGLSMAFTGAVGSFLPALAGRTATGFAGAASNVPGLALVSAWFAPRRRGLANGIVVGGSGLGMVIVGWAVPALLVTFGSEGWRYSWYVLGALTVLCALIVYLLLRDNPREKGLEPVGATPVNGAAPSAAEAPHYELADLYRLMSLWHLGGIMATWGFSYIVYTTFFAAYLTGERHLDPVLVGFLWSVAGVLSVFAGLIWGMVSDVVGRKWAMAIVLSLQAMSFALFAVQGGLEWVVLSTVLFGFTGWGVPCIMSATAGDFVGARMATAAVGFVWMLYSIGQATGPGVAGLVADATHSFVAAYLLAAVVGFIGVVGTLFLRPPRTQH